MEDIGHVAIEMAKIQKQRSQSVKKTNWELLREGMGRSFGAQKAPDKFSRIPNEVPLELSKLAQGAMRSTFSNAAA